MTNDADNFSSAPIQGFLSFPMSEISTELNGENDSCSPGAYHASLPAEPGSKEARRMTVGSGEKLCALLRNQGPVGYCLKTLLASTTWGSTEYYLTWKASATKSGFARFRLVPSTPRRSGRECGSWPTVTKEDQKTGNVCDQMYQNALATGTPPPTTSQRLRSVVKATWPTPQGYDGKRGGPTNPQKVKEGNHGMILTNYCPTGQSVFGSLARTESFVVRLMTLSAWLMGYTARHLAHWETQSAGRSRRKSLKP